MTRPIAVTGGLGFIGSAFIRRLFSRESKAKVINIDAGTYAADERRLEHLVDTVPTVYLDIRDPSLADLLAEARPSMLVHFAAETHVTRSESSAHSFHDANTLGTSNVLTAAEKAGVDLVVHVSTDEVYGPCSGLPFEEGDKAPGEGRATSAYARTKAVADDEAMAAAARLPVIVVRPSNCFGPWQYPEKAVPRWTIKALTKEGLPIWGDGGQQREWLYVEDACAAIETAIERGRPGLAYNVAPGLPPLTNLEMARLIARAAGRDIDEAVYFTAYDRPQHDYRYALNTSRLMALGYRPATDIETAIERTVSWYRDNRVWWEPLFRESETLYDDATERASV